MKDDELALVVCTPEDAAYLISKDRKFEPAIVTTSLLEVGTLFMIPAEEFLDYLFEGKHEEYEHISLDKLPNRTSLKELLDKIFYKKVGEENV